MLGKDLELIRTSWKAKRLNFGELKTVKSRYAWHDSLQRAFVTSRHNVMTRHKDQRPRRLWIEQFLYFGHNIF